MPARTVTWEDLPESIKQMDPDEREAFLTRNNAILIPRGVAPPPNAIMGSSPSATERNLDTSGTDVMGFGPGLTHPENRRTMAKAGVAAASTLAGGSGPMAAIISGALNAKYGPDVNSGRGVAENVANVAFGRLNPMVSLILNKGGSMAQATKNFLAGAGQVGATQAAGTALEGGDQDAGDLLLAGALGGAVPMATNRFLQSVQKSTPMVREKMRPIIEKLMPQAAEPPPMPTPPAVAQMPTPQPPAPKPPAVETDPFTRKIRDTVDYIEKKHPEMYGGAADDVSAQSSQNSLEDQLRASLIAAGKNPADIPPPTPKPAVPPPAPVQAAPKVDSLDEALGAGIKDEAQAIARQKARVALGDVDPDAYIDGIVTGKQPLDTLPQRLTDMDKIMPEFRDKLKTKMVENVLAGVGESGAFGDLSQLQRIQAFGKQKFGDKTGAQVINQVFGSSEAYRNLSDLQEILEMSGRGGESGKSNLRMIVTNNWKPVLTGSLGTVGGMVVQAWIPATAAIGTVAGGYTAGKLLTLGVDSVVEMLSRKNSKWADVLYDLASGGNRYSAQSVSNVISGLRRRAIEERDLKDEEAAQFGQ